VVVAILAAVAPGAHAAFAGANGRIAFGVAGSGIWSVNPDGTAFRQLTSSGFDTDPSWSPDGTRLAFVRATACCNDIYVVNADGSGEQLLRTDGQTPTWSPDGTEIAFVSNDVLWRMNSDGTNVRFEVFTERLNESQLAEPVWSPIWSPSGGRIAFQWIETETICVDPEDTNECYDVHYLRLGYHTLEDAPREPGSVDIEHLPVRGGDPDWSPRGDELVYVGSDIQAIKADGTGEPRPIVTSPEFDHSPAWSPDGTKIVFTRGGSTAERGLWVVGADGSNPTRIHSVGGYQSDWQPVSVNTPSEHIRPRSATRAQFSLVPAFEPCTAPNRQHGPPLAHPSCAPPRSRPSWLTVGGGTGPASSTGVVVFTVQPGAPGGADDTDVNLRLELTNVMRSSGSSEYTGEVRARATVRVTDRKGSVAPDRISSTFQDFEFEFDAPCVPTPATPGRSTCSVNTTLDAQFPGSTPEGTRAVWELDQVAVLDGGFDGNPDTEIARNNVFAVQGVFIP
jgi:TolB protein